MGRLNKQVVAWGLFTAVTLSAAAFSNKLPFVSRTVAKSREKQIAEAYVEGDEELKLLTTDKENGVQIDIRDNETGAFSWIAINKEMSITAFQAENSINAEKEANKNSLPTEQPVNVDESSSEQKVENETGVMETEAVVEAVQEEASEWANKVMANVEETANIREQADPDSTLVGRLRKGDMGEIVERTEEWTKIVSGNVTGYVKNDFLAFYEEAEALAAREGSVLAEVLTESLRIRKEPGEEAEIISMASQGDTYGAINEENGWVSILLPSGQTGYVSSEYVTVDLVLGKAISIEEEQAAIKAAEEKAAVEAAAKAAKVQEEQNKTVSKTQRDSTEASVDEVTLLGALVQVEAGGERYEGKLAVASVVVNRVNSSKFPNTIHGVIYQKGQFPGAHNGKVARIISNGVRNECMEAAREAIAGVNNIGGYLYFNSKGSVNTGKLSDYTIIGNQCFY